MVLTNPRSPGTHVVGSWVIDSISLYREPRTGTQYIGNWASRVTSISILTVRRAFCLRNLTFPGSTIAKRLGFRVRV